MLDMLKKFEKLITVTLVVLMAIVVLLATIELVWIIGQGHHYSMRRTLAI